MLSRMTDHDAGGASDPDDAWDAGWAAVEAGARSRLIEALGLDPDVDEPAPPGIVPAAAGARELVGQGAWPLDWVARAAGDLPRDDAAMLLSLLEAVVAPTHATGLGDGEALLLILEPDDWVDVTISLVRGGVGAPAAPDALAGLVEAQDELLEPAFGLVVPVWQACGVADLDQRLTRVGAWLLPRAVEAALRG